MAEIENVINQINELVKKINATNSSATLDDGHTLTEALANRDSIMLQKRTIESIIEAAVIKRDRYTRTEVKYITTVNVAELQKQIDKLSAEFRILDTKIQEKNWTTELA